VIHELKCWPESFSPIWRGEKRAEFRIDDRGFRTEDELVLLEWKPRECALTGRKLRARITHILRGPNFGVPEGYSMLSIEVVSREGEDPAKVSSR